MTSKKEVFRMCEEDFDKDAFYATALKTSTEGRWPNEKHYTTNKLIGVGKFIKHRYEGGYHDNAEYSELFIHNDTIIRVKLDYDGRTCFVKIDESEIDDIYGPDYLNDPNSPDISFENST